MRNIYLYIALSLFLWKTMKWITTVILLLLKLYPGLPDSRFFTFKNRIVLAISPQIFIFIFHCFHVLMVLIKKNWQWKLRFCGIVLSARFQEFIWHPWFYLLTKLHTDSFRVGKFWKKVTSGVYIMQNAMAVRGNDCWGKNRQGKKRKRWREKGDN